MISFTVGIVSYFVQSIYQNHSSIVPRIIQGILKFNTQGWAEEQNPTFARLFYK
ncbi:transposase [Nodularia spumigena CCY9414]|nr:transposase [Nodularia spumigena CCY9414]